jgi:hypothetical protein
LYLDDASGLVHVSGAAEAVSSADVWTRDTMSADWVELRLTPGGSGDEECGPRVLLGVRAGRSGGADSQRVKVESRRYEMPVEMAAGSAEGAVGADAGGDARPDERYLERLLYLEGDRLDADGLIQQRLAAARRSEQDTPGRGLSQEGRPAYGLADRVPDTTNHTPSRAVSSV